MVKTALRMVRLTMVAALCWCLAGGCTHARPEGPARAEVKGAANKGQDDSAQMPKVSESQAVELARKELLKQGVNVDDYRVAVQSSTDGARWLVVFDPKVQREPGEGYWFTVDKVSGKTVWKPQD